MPTGLVKTQKDEKIWNRAKETVSRNKHIPETKFKDEHWAMVNVLFKIIKNRKGK